MRKLFAVSAAVLVAVGLSACSEGRTVQDPGFPVPPNGPAVQDPGAPVPPAPGAPAPGVPAPGAPAAPNGPTIQDPGVAPLPGAQEDIDELMRQLEELGLSSSSGSSGSGYGSGSSGSDYGFDSLDDQLSELEELLDQLESGNFGSSGSGSTYGSTGTTYGSDPTMDGLWDSCAAGNMGDCDSLYLRSPFDSDYEAFGESCGGRGRPEGNVMCEW